MNIKRIGIVVGGGPAPGTNGVISAVAIEAIKIGCVPIGVHDGFDWLAQRYTDEQHELAIDEVSRVHLDGGVLLGSSRRDVTRDPESLDNTLAALAKLKIDALVCIGGDDMVKSAAEAEDRDLDEMPLYTLDEATQMLATIQNLDPPGVGARDLRECLLNQLHPDMHMYEELQLIIDNGLGQLKRAG